MHTAPEGQAQQSLGIISDRLSLAMIIGIPAGTLIGQALGWRATFALIAAFSLILLLILFYSLPRVQALTSRAGQALASVARNRAPYDLPAAGTGVTGYFIIFSYRAVFGSRSRGARRGRRPPIICW